MTTILSILRHAGPAHREPFAGRLARGHPPAERDAVALGRRRVGHDEQAGDHGRLGELGRRKLERDDRVDGALGEEPAQRRRGARLEQALGDHEAEFAAGTKPVEGATHEIRGQVDVAGTRVESPAVAGAQLGGDLLALAQTLAQALRVAILQSTPQE